MMAVRIMDNNGKSVDLLLEFSHENEGYHKDMYLEFLKEGMVVSVHQRRSPKLRLELFNMLEEEWWKYHGDCSNPWILQDTVYDPIADKALIEENFDILVPYDKGHPTASYNEWLKRTDRGGLSIHKRRKVRAPRLLDGSWDRERMKKKKKLSKHIRRTWCRWDQTIPEGNYLYAYYERR